MSIRSVEIRNIYASSLDQNADGVEHIKSLPCLSVVQAVHGEYEIGLNGGQLMATGEGGIFVAPTGSLQQIIHHNGSSGCMRARWVFMNVTINDGAAIEDMFDFPQVLPSDECDKIGQLIARIQETDDICARYAVAYEIVGRLIALASPKQNAHNETMARIIGYVSENYSRRITKEELARHAYCSVPHMYRLFQKNLATTPANYINQVRLQHAAVELERSDIPIGEVAARAGFDDPAYFAKLFRNIYAISPREYRSRHRY